MDPVYPVNYLR